MIASKPMKNPSRSVSRWQLRSGFALIITLSLMVLLTILSVGLLTLSSIELRASSQREAMAIARSNARLALSLALADLQKNAGPDTRITATAETLGDDIKQPLLCGIWNSRKLNPANPDSASNQDHNAKAGDFRKWLISDDEPSATADQKFPEGPASPEGVLLVSRDRAGDSSKEVRAGRVKISNEVSGKPTGTMAYAAFDEGVKARVNLGQKSPGSNLAARTEALGTGQRLGIDRIEGVTTGKDEDFDLATEDGRSLVTKMIGLGESEMGHGAEAHSFDKHFHDLTAYSLGLMTRVTTGGLKEDINLLAQASPLPSEFAGAKIYGRTFSNSPLSDPYWKQVLDYANLFQAKNGRNQAMLMSSNGLPTLRAGTPQGWTAGTAIPNAAATPVRANPQGVVLMPSIAKVQTVFTIMARDIYTYPKGSVPQENSAQLHGPWGDNFRGSSYDYLLHLLYTPVITLHNPYNVAIEFTNLNIEFRNVPLALQVFRNGVAQTKSPVPLGRMYASTDNAFSSKRFGMTLANKNAAGAPAATPIRMLPGEVKVFSPYIQPTLTWAAEANSQVYFSDWRNESNSSTNTNTSTIRAIPGWRGDGIGYDLDWFCTDDATYAVTTNERENGKDMHRGGCIGLRAADEIHLEFSPTPDPQAPDNRFTVEMTLTGASSNPNARTSVLEFNYEARDGLQKNLLGTAKTIRYPEDGTVNTMAMLDHSTTPLKDYARAKPFALFSAYAKTTHGGFDASQDDGSYAAKPWMFNNHTGMVSTQKVLSEHPAHHAHEINLVRLPGNTNSVIDIQPGTDRGNFITGHTAFNGRRFGTLFDVPLGPIQSLVSLNGADLAAGYYLPRFTAPIGNSLAHPLMPTSSIISGTMVDHCYMLNSVLFDGFYCSGLQTRGGPVGDGKSTADLAGAFLKDSEPLADSRFLPHLADGVTVDVALGNLEGAEGYKKAAAYQLLQGAFNVNSTSIDAWRAVLSSMTGSGGAVFTVPIGGGIGTTESIGTLSDADDEGARFSRFRLPNGQADSGNPDALWTGPRDLTDDELTRLATEIVKQVKERGPFLSMGEFVNRQLGSSGENTLAGALQVAIDRADLNEDADLGGYDIDSSKLTELELQTPDALLGPSAEGAPGYLMQADILGLLGNSATVRSDTFLIRSYGECLDAQGKPEARAWCEAVVQRLPEYCDPGDATDVLPEDLQKEANKAFGRRIEIVSFRWLNAEEI